MEEVKKKVNRPVPELPLSEDTDFLVNVKATPVRSPGGNGQPAKGGAAANRIVASLSDAIARFQQDAPTCPNCGHVAVRNGACFKCLNCGESLGCS